MRELTIEIKKIRSEGEGKALAQAQEDLAETREVKDKVTHDLEKAKKVGVLQKFFLLHCVNLVGALRSPCRVKNLVVFTNFCYFL